MTAVITNYSGQTIKLVDKNNQDNYMTLAPDASGGMVVTADGVVSVYIYNSSGTRINNGSAAFRQQHNNYIVYQSSPLTDGAVGIDQSGVDYTNRYVVKGGIATPLTSTSFASGSVVGFVNDPNVSLSDYGTVSTSSSNTSNTTSSSGTSNTSSSGTEDSYSYMWIVIVMIVVILIIVAIIIAAVVYKKRMANN